MFNVGYDQRSLSEIAQFYGFNTFLSDEMRQSMQQAGDLLQGAAVANTWQVFTSPTGELADSIEPILISPYEVQIGVGVAWGRRREEGFMGMTDSLGRGPFNDPAKPYMAPALADNEQAVLTLIEQAAQRAFTRMGASF
jgi:hypothetical protein